jgi:hypothetical protein
MTKDQKSSTVKIINETNIKNTTFVKGGYVIQTRPTYTTSVPGLNLAVGGVYQNGNESRSFVNLTNTGVLIGSFPNSESQNDYQQNSYNFLTSNISGLYDASNGKWSDTHDYYDVNRIYSWINESDDRYFCKILGLGIGDSYNLKVSKVSRSGISTMGTDTLTESNQFKFSNDNILKLTNVSAIIDGFVSPYTYIGETYYMEGFDWVKFYGIEVINGTNTFPFFGWAGTRIGSLKPQSFQFAQNALYNYPSSYLEIAKGYNPIGIIYAGQGVQYNSFPIIPQNKKYTFDDRNNRTYQEYIDTSNSDYRITGIVPYQQGRGVYDFFSNEVTYNLTNGLIDFVESNTVIGAEGAQPGRNNAFAGFAITDYYSDDININNIQHGSLTTKNTRANTQISNSKTAHNAPLCYSSNDANNTYNPLPWSPLFAYVGTSGASTSNEVSDSVPVMKEGFTTSIISGAFPLYRAAWSDTWGGGQVDSLEDFYGNTIGFDQYYINTNFWEAGIPDPATPEIFDLPTPGLPSVPPNPPYRIKGAKIVLFEGQRVKAGSYVYSTMNLIGNVTMPQFFPPGAKESILENRDQNQILSDVYSRFQSNQGGLVVMVSTENQEPPMPPSCCQPIGIVMEDLIGFGNPEYNDNEISQNVKYSRQPSNNTSVQPVIDPSKVNFIQSREIMIKIFPMYANMNLSAIPVNNIFIYSFDSFLSIAAPGTVRNGNPNNLIVPSTPIIPPGGLPGISISYFKVKSNYVVQAGDEFSANVQDTTLPITKFPNSLIQKQGANDWPPPQRLADYFQS